MSLKTKFIKKHKSLITGIEEIDAQHEEFFGAIQALEYPNKSQQDLWDILLKIEIYARTHFETEESYMKKFNYPIIDEHIIEHEFFMENFRK